MQEIARTRVRYGYRRIHVLLKREGWQVGKNQRIGSIAKSSYSFARSYPSAGKWW